MLSWQNCLQVYILIFLRKFSVLLATSQKLHIKVFASEAFAFLIRKSKNSRKIITFLLERIDNELNEGVGHLLFHTIKGIKSQLSLNGTEFLETILESLYNDKLQIDAVSDISIKSKSFNIILKD